MRMRSYCLALSVFCLLNAADTLAAQSARSEASMRAVTVGDFIIRLADALSPHPGRIRTLDDARGFFTSQGIIIPSVVNLDEPLTQERVAVSLSFLGVKARPDEPEKTFSEESVEGFLAYLREGVKSGRVAVGSSPAGRPSLALADTSSGACCTDGECTQTSPGGCVEGVFTGSGIPCDPDPCKSNVGQCCLARHECIIASRHDCQDQGGVFTGGDSCAPPGNACKGQEPVTPTQP